MHSRNPRTPCFSRGLVTVLLLSCIASSATERGTGYDNAVSAAFGALDLEDVPCPDDAGTVGDEAYARCARLEDAAGGFRKRWRRALRKSARDVRIVEQELGSSAGTFTGAAITSDLLRFRYEEDGGLLTVAPEPTCFAEGHEARQAVWPAYHEDIDAAELLASTPPRYPEKARESRRQGLVLLEAYILPDGRIGDACEIYSDKRGYGFEDAALEAVRASRYRPAEKDGEAIPSRLRIKLAFTLH